MGKSTISMAMFNSFLYVYQRVCTSNLNLCCRKKIWMIHLAECWWHSSPHYLKDSPIEQPKANMDNDPGKHRGVGPNLMIKSMLGGSNVPGYLRSSQPFLLGWTTPCACQLGSPKTESVERKEYLKHSETNQALFLIVGLNLSLIESRFSPRLWGKSCHPTGPASEMAKAELRCQSTWKVIVLVDS